MDIVIDIVGGAVLAAAVPLLGEGGAAVAVGAISGEPTVLAPDVLASPARRRVQGYWGHWPVGDELRELTGLVAGATRRRWPSQDREPPGRMPGWPDGASGSAAWPPPARRPSRITVVR
ncbi:MULTISPECIES: hypothetical protein [unclassified Pseudofrankia]|uniref:hypothetical protein n=1 Tax=unclassified Pseudofrankia TaxID=2994372 RepID=UPI0008DA961A|nr:MULTISPECIES: hypothetical protein [unclassified Pseudofrankia]MDT3444043.1 hypothetical protein [Pseudofrankia sp. BMG5.37]